MDKQVFLDLGCYMNRRIFFPTAEEALASEHAREWDISSCEDLFSALVEGRETAYRFCRNREFQDNVACGAQKIDAGGVLCDRVSLAGFSVWGEFRETFFFRFRNREEKREIFFRDLTDVNYIPFSGDGDAEREWFAQAAPRLRDLTIQNSFGPRTVHLYEQTFVFPEADALEEIVLPDNPLMRIFAITVAQGGKI